MKYKIAALTSHPIQYQAPLFRKLSEHPNIDLTVYFCSDVGVKDSHIDQGFGVEVKWDIPLLDGYKYKFLHNLSKRDISSFFGLINPSICNEIRLNYFDAIWVHGYAHCTNWLAFLGAMISKTPILLRGESNLLHTRSTWKKGVKYFLLRPLFKIISGFLAIGTFNKEYYIHYGVPEEKIFHVPYVVDNDFFTKERENIEPYNNALRKDLGINQGNVVILYVGKIFGRKGPGAFNLLQAFENVNNCYSSTNLIFVGDGKEKSILENYVKQRNIKNVIFVGFKNQTQLPRYYSIADILVLPSHTEQWGLVINEAMCFNTAIIASNKVGATIDLVHHDQNGYIFTVGNINELAYFISKLVSDKKLLDSMKRNSSLLIRNWSIENCISGILAALNYVRRGK